MLSPYCGNARAEPCDHSHTSSLAALTSTTSHPGWEASLPRPLDSVHFLLGNLTVKWRVTVECLGSLKPAGEARRTKSTLLDLEPMEPGLLCL